jgi:hypothetical protein
VRDVTLGMDVNNLNRSAGNDQRDAQQREDKPPRALHLRSGTRSIHAGFTISQDADCSLDAAAERLVSTLQRATCEIETLSGPIRAVL